MTATQIIDDALALPEDDRSYLAAKLLESLDGGLPDEFSPGWNQEVASRICEIDKGRVKMIPSDEVFANARARVVAVKESKKGA